MLEKLYISGEAARMFRVSYVVVKKRVYSGKNKFVRTPGGKFSILKEREIELLFGEWAPEERAALYARVGSADQKDELEG